jgi:hypothetical protein
MDRESNAWPTVDWLSEGVRALYEPAPDVEFHANEFYKITLGRKGGWVRRIHVWPSREPGSPGGNVHGHCWPFCSLVLAGELEEALYTVRSGSDYVEYSFSSGREQMARVGGSGLSLVSRVRHREGSFYRREPEVLHRAYPVEGPTISLVAHPITRQQSARVFVREGASAAAADRHVDAAEIVLIREQLRDVLTRGEKTAK